MTIEQLLGLRTWMPVFDKESETGGGSTDGDGDTGGDDGVAVGGGDGTDGDDTDAKDAGKDDGTSGDDDDGVVVDGGTADGEANSDDNEDGDDGDDDGDDPVPGEDEDYDWAAHMPDGMEVDAKMAEAIGPTLKELGIGQKAAGKLAEAMAAHQQAAGEAVAQEAVAIVKGWKDEAKADKEVGHAEWNRSVELANGVIKQFGTPELVQDVMVGQGIGNHPEVIRLLTRIGKHIAEDTAMTGKETETETSPEAKWYGATTPTSKKG